MARDNIQKLEDKINAATSIKYRRLKAEIEDTNIHEDDPSAFGMYELRLKLDALIDDVNSNITPPVYAQYYCTDTTTNINDNRSDATIDFGSADLISDASDFSISRGRITVANAGIYEIHFSIVMFTSAVQRANPYIRLTKNASDQTITGGSYIRKASNHNTNISSATGLLSLAANDVLDVRSRYDANYGATGTVTMKAGTKIIIKKLG